MHVTETIVEFKYKSFRWDELLFVENSGKRANIDSHDETFQSYYNQISQ